MGIRILAKTRSGLLAVSPPAISALTRRSMQRQISRHTCSDTLSARCALPRLELFFRRSKLSPCFPRGESYQFGTVNPGIVLHLLIGLKTVSYFRRISQRRSRRKAGLVLLQFWHGQLGSSGGFRRKPIHSKCTGASSRKLRSDSGWVSALWRLPGDTMKS